MRNTASPVAPLQSVSNALQILLLLRESDDLGVLEVAKKLKVGQATAHRLLSTLLAHGFVEQEGAGRRYRLGPSMTKSSDALAIEHCIDVSMPLMEQLRDESKETVHISILEGAKAQFVSAVESPLMVRVASRIGRAIPAHTSAAGKVLLAELEPSEFGALYPDETLSGGTEGSVHTRTELRRELRTVRSVGFGRNIGESEQGLAALAVPVRRPAGRLLCTLTLTGPQARFNPRPSHGMSAREHELLGMLHRYATQISKKLAY